MKWTLVPIPSSFEPLDDLRPGRSQPIEREADDVQVPGVRAVRGVRSGVSIRSATVDSAEARRVAPGQLSPGLEQLLRAIELDQAERRGDVGHVVLVAGVLDLVVPRAAGGVAVPGGPRLMPWSDMSRARSAIAGSSVTSIPPSPVVIVFVA